MINNDLIFSNKWQVRLKRHLLFWTCWGLYFTALHAAQPYGKAEISYFRNIPFTVVESVLLLIPHVILTYYALYFILEKFLMKQKYLLAIVFLLPVWLASCMVNIVLIQQVVPNMAAFLLPERYLEHIGRPPAVEFYMALLSSFKGAYTITAGAVGIRFIKRWYLKEQRNLQLQRENADAQLQLLTAQVHPHFLFNTLNNIYSQTQTESPKGSMMIMELSDMLRYILAEGGKARVPLQKELTMIQDYMNLEKIRYGNKLDLHLSLPDNTRNLQIAPLILLPFVENCFKHGASRFLNAPWIHLKIELEGQVLVMKLMNGKDPAHQERLPRSGTGIANVKKRLDLIYPGKYELDITDEPEVFVVNLRLQLTEGVPEGETIIKTPSQPVYAE